MADFAGDGGIGANGACAALAGQGVSPGVDWRQKVESQDVDLRAARRRRLQVLAAHLGAVAGADAGVAAQPVGSPLHDFWIVGDHFLAVFAVSAHEGGWA